MKTVINNYLKNLLGWRTNRKVVIFSIDDYGNVRLASRQARENLDKAGLKVLSRFDAFDSLETKDDLSALYETLSSVKDKNGSPAVFTAFSVPCNIDFEKMAEENYREYHYELLPETFEKLSSIDPQAYEGAWDLWKEGMEKNLIHPEFHGREHFNLKVFNEKLKVRDEELLTSLKNRSLTSVSDTGYSSVSFTGAFKFWDFNENDELKNIITTGLNEFEKVFGFRASHFNAPGGPEHSILHKTLSDNGVKYIDAPLIKNEHQGHGKYKKVLNWTGKKNKHGQIFQVRNCVFEPTQDRGFDWVNYTFNQIETAFKLKRPAIISSHRVNFCGHIDPKNREKGLTALRDLLQKIISKYPDVEFMSSRELGEMINR